MSDRGLRGCLAHLEARLRLRKPRPFLVWSDAGEPRPDVPPGGVMPRRVHADGIEGQEEDESEGRDDGLTRPPRAL